MKTEFKLSDKDKNHQKNINDLINDIMPLIVEFYGKYNVIVNGVLYDSTLEFNQKTEITFNVTPPPGFYVDFKINVLNSDMAYLKPSERIFRGVFYIRGISNKVADNIYDVFGISRLLFIDNNNKSSVYKIQEILLEAEKQSLSKWRQYIIADNIFIF